MYKTLILTRKELAGFFNSLTAYILIIIFLGFSGFFTWFFGNTVFFTKQANLQVFFSIAYWTLFFFIPALTMRSVAEERRTSTLEMLCTKAISDGQIIAAKFLSCLALVLIVLLCTLPYYITVAQLGKIDHGSVWGGYIGLCLLSSAYISIGLLMSSSTQNQIVAFLLTLFVTVFFHLLFDIIANNMTGGLSTLFQGLSTRTHYTSISRGVLDSRDIIYFLSLTALGLAGAQLSLSKRIWKT